MKNPAPAHTPSQGVAAPSRTGFSRRAVGAAAWATPVVLASVTTPALAASVMAYITPWSRTAGSVALGSPFGTSEVFVTADGTAAPAGTLVTFDLGTGLAWSTGGSAPLSRGRFRTARFGGIREGAVSLLRSTCQALPLNGWNP